MKQSYTNILHNHNYMKMLLANFINRLGDSIDMMAFTWLTYQLTNSASWAALMFGVNMLPNMIFLPFTGAWIEKRKKKWIIVSCDLVRAGLTCLTLLLYLNDSLSIVILLFVTFFNNSVECLRVPGAKGLLPYLLSKSEYEYGLSLDASLSKVTELVGIACSGMIIGVLGISGAIFTDLMSFLICAIILSTLRIHETMIKQEGKKLQVYFTTLKEGFQYILHKPLILALCFSAVLLNGVLVPFNAYQAAYVSGTLHQGPELLSLTSFTLTLGMGIGSMCYPFLHNYVNNRNLFLYFSYGIVGYYCAMIPLCWISNAIFLYLIFGVLSLMFGLCMGVVAMVLNVCLMKQLDDAYVSRVSAISGALSVSANPIVSFLLSGCSLIFPVETIFFIFGFFTFFIITGMMFSKTLKQM